MAQFTDPRLQRQFAMARGLRDQSMSPQGGQMVSGHYVGGGPLDAVRQLAQAYQGNKMFDQANQAYNTQQQQLLDALRGGGMGQGQMPMQGATPGINPQQPMNTGMANALPKSGSPFPNQAGQGQYNQPDVIDRLASLDNPMARQMAIDMQLQRMSQQPQGRFRTLSQDEAAMMGLPSNSVWQMSPDGEIKPAYEAKTPDYNDLIMLGPNGEPIINEQLLAIKRQLAEAGRPSTDIRVGGEGNRYEVGTIPQGFMQEYDEQGRPTRQVPIPGGPADIEQQDLAEKSRGREESQRQTANLLSQDISLAKNMVQNNPNLTSGFLGNMMAGWAGSPAADVNALLDTIGANISFDYLNQMRANSPTGGALGNVTERELDLLRATAGNISQRQSPEQLVRSLERLERQFNEVIHGTGAQMQQQNTGWSVERID